MSVKDRILTYEDLGKIPEGFEIVEGRLKESAPVGGEHGFLEQKLGRKIDEKLEKEGYVLVGEVGLLISKDPLTVRAADTVYISKKKLRSLPKGVIETPPDLVVEIISPSDTFEEVEEKVADYMDFGVGRILLIDPSARKVTLIDEERRIQIKSFDEEVEVISGLKLRMSELGGSE